MHDKHPIALLLPALLLVLAAAACSSDDSGKDAAAPPQDAAGERPKIETLVPAPDEVAGWGEDPEVGKPGVEAGYTYDEIIAIINGHHQPYADEGTAGFAKQDYLKSKDGEDYTLALEIWQMNTAAGATAMLNKNKTDGETKLGLVWEAIAGLDEEGIAAKDARQWTIFARRGPYVFQIFATAPEPSLADAIKQDALDFALHLANKLTK